MGRRRDLLSQKHEEWPKTEPMKRIILISIMLLFLAPPGRSIQAQSRDIAPKNLEDIERLDFDNPRATREWARKTFLSTDPQRDPKLWVLSFLAWSRTKRGIHEMPEFQDQARKAAEIAETLQMKAEAIIIRHIARLELSDDIKDHQKSLNEAIREAENLGLFRLRLRLISDHADTLMGDADVEKRGRLLNEVSEALKNEPSLTHFDKLVMKNSLALYLDVQGQIEQAESLYLDIIPAMRRIPLRGALSGVLYNLGRLYFDQKDLPKVQQSGPYFDEAYAMAKSVEDFEAMGAALMGSSDVHRLLARPKEAFERAEQSVKAFEEQHDAYWLSRGYTCLARALVAGKRYQDALDAVQAAEKTLLAPRTQQKWEWSSLRTAAYKAQEKWKEGFEALEQANHWSSELSREAANEELAKQAVKLGLDVETQRVKVLQKNNELQSERLQRADEMRKLLIVLLALAVISLFVVLFAVKKEREVQQQKRKTESILDNLEEGVLLINSKGLIEPGYSRYLMSLLDLTADPAGQPVLDSIFSKLAMSQEERSLLDSTLTAILGENEIAWEMNALTLPTKVTTLTEPKRILELHWQPIRFPKSTDIQRILLGIRDITERQHLQDQVHAEKEHSDRIYEKFAVWLRSNKNLSQRFLEQILDFVRRQEQDRATNLRDLHTIKGISRSLGYQSLSVLIHRLEDDLKSDPQGSLTSLEAWPQFLLEVDDLQKLMTLTHKGSTPSQWLSQLEASWSEITKRLTTAGLPPASLEITQEGPAWPDPMLAFLSTFVIHGLNNAADHGYIRPKQEGRALNRPFFKLQIQASETSWQVSILDSGAGINWSRLQELALQKNFVPEEGRPLTDLLLQDQVSTAESVSESSGRGLGLAAIDKACRDLGGTLTLRDRDEGTGTILQVTFPRQSISSGIAGPTVS